MKYIAAIACLLLSSAASAAESAWFIPLSIVTLEGDESRVTASASGPSINLNTRSALGLAAGLGYRFKNGLELSGSLLRVKQDVDASWSTPTPGSFSYDSSRVGLMFSVNIPLGGK